MLALLVIVTPLLESPAIRDRGCDPTLCVSCIRCGRPLAHGPGVWMQRLGVMPSLVRTSVWIPSKPFGLVRQVVGGGDTKHNKIACNVLCECGWTKHRQPTLPPTQHPKVCNGTQGVASVGGWGGRSLPSPQGSERRGTRIGRTKGTPNERTDAREKKLPESWAPGPTHERMAGGSEQMQSIDVRHGIKRALAQLEPNWQHRILACESCARAQTFGRANQ